MSSTVSMTISAFPCVMLAQHEVSGSEAKPCSSLQGTIEKPSETLSFLGHRINQANPFQLRLGYLTTIVTPNPKLQNSDQGGVQTPIPLMSTLVFYPSVTFVIGLAVDKQGVADSKS